jgi:hypothetical protein
MDSPGFRSHVTNMSRNPPTDPAGEGNRDQKDRGGPEIIVEFLFERGVFHISIRNIGDRPALGISVKFDKKIVGLGGRKEVSALPLFRNIEFLGPGREITTLLDTSDSYFARKQPMKVSARITYADTARNKYEAVINHDLEIYRELSYLTADPHPGCCQK